MEDKKRVLVVCPSFPLVESGAEQMDRAEGIRQLVRLGCEVVVLAKVVEWADSGQIEGRGREMGIKKTVLIPYKFSNRKLSTKEKILKFIGKLRNPLYFDGAAYEYTEPEVQHALERELASFKPHVVWFEYTYLWPLYSIARASGAKIVTRSLNFEPTHFLEEDGYSLMNYLKYIPKHLSEWIVAKKSDVVLAINPNEATIYKKLGSKSVLVLPLRNLPGLLRPQREIKDSKPLHVFFMGSSYLVAHNRQALSFIVTELAPRLEKELPGKFVFHISGSKIPESLLNFIDGSRVIYEGYIKAEEFETYIGRMDATISPSAKRVGMQGKVFEPLARGIPLVTNPNNSVGYPFENGKEYLGAQALEEYAEALKKLLNPAVRAGLSERASAHCAELFSQEKLDDVARHALKNK